MPPYEPEKHEARDRRDLLVPGFFLVLAGLLLVLPMPVQQQISTVLRSSVLAPFIWTQESIRQTRVRAREIAGLQAQLDSALAVLFSQHTLEDENRRLRALLDLNAREVPGFVPASAIRPGTRGSESMFLLDVGTADGVEVNDPVVVAGGLIGVVREVGVGTALAMDWTHPDFRVSVMTRDGEAFGIVGPRLGAFREEARLLLSSVPYHTPVELGALVVTSGQGGVYPRGIPVGTILELAESEAGWQRSYWLDPAVTPGTANHVLVLTGDVLGYVEDLEFMWLEWGRAAEEDPLEPGESLPGLDSIMPGSPAAGPEDAVQGADMPQSGGGSPDVDGPRDEDAGAGPDAALDPDVPDAGFDPDVPDAGFDPDVPDAGFDPDTPDAGSDTDPPAVGLDTDPTVPLSVPSPPIQLEILGGGAP